MAKIYYLGAAELPFFSARCAPLLGWRYLYIYLGTTKVLTKVFKFDPKLRDERESRAYKMKLDKKKVLTLVVIDVNHVDCTICLLV